MSSPFLEVFGRPDANLDPPCERSSNATMIQTLHLMNSPNVQRRVLADNGLAAQLAASEQPPAMLITQLYLATYSRPASEEELQAAMSRFTDPAARRQSVEDSCQGADKYARVPVQELRNLTISWSPGLQPMNRRDYLRLGVTAVAGGTFSNLLQLGSEKPPKATPSQSRRPVAFSSGWTADHRISKRSIPSLKPTQKFAVNFPPSPQNPACYFAIFQRLASISDKLCIVRSICHNQNNHGAGNHYMTTGSPTRIPVACGAYVSFHPSLGSVTAHERTTRVGCPRIFRCPHVSLGRFQFSGAAFAPFVVGDDPNRPEFRVRDVRPPADITDLRFNNRRDLRALVDRLPRLADKSSGDPVSALDSYYEQSYDLIGHRKAQQAFDIGKETEAVRDAYGRHGLGQRMLLARRLVEAGVPFITINKGGWDSHSEIFKTTGLVGKLPPFDQALAALIQDLDDRSLLDSTLVVALGEFGRTPKISTIAGGSSPGRDHWSSAMSVLFAGCGTPRGAVIGETDKNGYAPVERPWSPENFASTVYLKLGIDPNKILYTPLGRPTHLVSDPTPIKGLMG